MANGRPPFLRSTDNRETLAALYRPQRPGLYAIRANRHVEDSVHCQCDTMGFLIRRRLHEAGQLIGRKTPERSGACVPNWGFATLTLHLRPRLCVRCRNV